jgi:outer membrane protein OmpA-like peptidoglycan-associated protein
MLRRVDAGVIQGIKMKKIQATPILIAVAILLSACSSVPTSTSLLSQAHSDYLAAQENPNVARYAPVEMKQASAALEQADAAASDRDNAEKVDKLAYLAKQKIALTQELAQQKSAEASIAASARERDQMRLDQRTNEADQAHAAADRARQDTQLAQGRAADAQRQTQDALARNAQLESQLADLAAKKTDRGLVITLGDVLFGSDQSHLTQNGMRTAQKLADVLRQNPQRTVLVEGFTDSTGGAGYNQQLSERRATAVRSALQDMGIALDRIAVRGYGEGYPVAANDTMQNRQMNRRVEIVLSDASGKIAPR